MDNQTEKQKVLIIDDDASHRRLAQTIFERDGFDVSIATEGSEGIRQAMMKPPNIIILDIMMEGLHGFEVCKMLRTNTNLRHTAIIVVSGKTYKTDIDKALELGADAYLIKPFAPKELLEIAKEKLNKRATHP